MDERNDIREDFSALLDGELDPERRARVEAILAEHSDGLRELHDYQRVNALYRQLPRVRAPENFEALLMARLHPKAAAAADARRRYWRRGLLAAAAVLLICAGLAIYERYPAGQFEMAEAPPPPEEAQLQYQRHSEEIMAQQQLRRSSAQDESAAGSASAIAGEIAEDDTADAPPPGEAAAPMMMQAEPAPEVAPAAESEAARSAPLALQRPEDERRADADAAVRPAPEVPPVEALPPPAAMTAPEPPASPVPDTSDTPEERIEEAETSLYAYGAPDTAAAKVEPEAVTAPEPPASAPIASEPAPQAPPQPMRRRADDARGEAEEDAYLGYRAGQPSIAAQTANGRLFYFVDGVWSERVQRPDEERVLRRDTAAFDDFTAAHPDVEGILRLGPRVAFAHEGLWYRVLPAEASVDEAHVDDEASVDDASRIVGD